MGFHEFAATATAWAQLPAGSQLYIRNGHCARIATYSAPTGQLGRAATEPYKPQDVMLAQHNTAT